MRGNGLRSTNPESSHQLSRQRRSDSTCLTDCAESRGFSSASRYDRMFSAVTRLSRR